MPRRLNAEGGAEITWDDVLKRVGVALTDIDHIRYPTNWSGGEEDEGAPTAVYSDPVMLRRWLETHHPSQVCDGPSCAKQHELHQDGPCDGRMARANALNRTMSDLSRTVRGVNPKLSINAKVVSDFLDGTDVSGYPNQRQPGPWDKLHTGCSDGILYTEALGWRWYHIPGEPVAPPLPPKPARRDR